MTEIVDPEALRCHIEKSVGDLPALPTVVSRVLTLTDDPDCTAAEIQKVVSSDQALTGKILRVANSAFYGLPTPVSSIAHGVMLLGVRQLRNLTLSLAAMSLVKARGGRMAEHQNDFWRHSFAVASASNAIALRVKATKDIVDDAFTGGLLHDIGRLFLLGYFSEFFERVLAISKEKQLTITEAERELLGMDHMDIGGMLGARWNFPSGLEAIIRTHHEPWRAMEGRELVYCVHIADALASAADSSEGDAGDTMDEAAREWTRMDSETGAEILAEISASVSAAEELLGIAA